MTVLRNAELLLAAGDVLRREEFLRRWEASPEIKKAIERWRPDYFRV